jgi:hypothetical protein
MFEERPAIESEQERSLRHSRMVTQATVFSVLLVSVFFAVAVAWTWIRDDVLNIEPLLVPFGIITSGLAVGMFFEVRRHW